MKGVIRETAATALPPGCTIANVHRGKGPRASWFYADVLGPDGATLISATLEYCVRRVCESVPMPAKAAS